MATLTGTQFDVLLQIAMRKGGLVLYREFRPWNREWQTAEHHPVADVVVVLRKRFRGQIGIVTEPGRGYRLAADIPVTEVAGPSVRRADRLRAIALDRMNIFTRESLLASIATYEEVLRHGPDADAYVNLAMNYINKGHVGFSLDRPQRTIPKARGILEEALQRFPKFSSAYALRALTRLIYDFDWKGAENDLQHAFDLNSDDSYAHIIAAHREVARGSFDTGLAHARRSAELDWRSPMSVFTFPWLLTYAGQANQAKEECECALVDFDPFAVGHIICGYAYEALGMTNNAIDQYKASLEIAQFPDAYACLGHAYGIKGDQHSAEHYLRRLGEMKDLAFNSGYFEALVYVAIGNRKGAVRALWRALDEKCDWLIYLNVEHRWDPLRNLGSFRDLVKRVGLL